MYRIACPRHLRWQMKEQLAVTVERLRELPSIREAVLWALACDDLTIACGRGRTCKRKRGTFDPWLGLVVCDLEAGPAVLAHELVHAVGGSELDAELVENLLFAREEGAELPTRGDLFKFQREGSAYFCEHRRRGLQERETGRRLHVRVRDVLGREPARVVRRTGVLVC